MQGWLDHLQDKSIEWVRNAIKADTFASTSSESAEQPTCSSSITDVFSAIYQQLDFIADLKWKDSVQNATFLEMFTKIIHKSISEYCDALTSSELKGASNSLAGWQELLAGGKSSSKPQDISMEVIPCLYNILMSPLVLYKALQRGVCQQEIRRYLSTYEYSQIDRHAPRKRCVSLWTTGCGILV